MDILKKKDYDKCERSGFRLNQKVFFKRKNKKSKILAIDTSGDDNFKFFIEDGEGDFLKRHIPGCGTKYSLDKKGIWCRKEDIASIADDKLVPFNIKDYTNKSLSIRAETNDEKLKYSKYKNRVFFVKAVDGTELGFSDVNKLAEVKKEKDAEAVVIMFQNASSDVEDLLRTIMSLNPENHSAILECIIFSGILSGSHNTVDLLNLLANYELIVTFSYNVVNTSRAILIKI